ncbi:MAG: type IV secretion system DNA-binding domain-containing protein [Candidatus Gracilibacteria bacterium]|nr:type IV secretion system DNA-binding domain-containing protein [Candidatus Gracilibacteria bacterium]
MLKSHLIKIYHSYNLGRKHFQEFLKDIAKTLDHKRIVFGINYNKGEYFYSLDIEQKVLTSFESQFYSFFNNFQIDSDTKNYNTFNTEKTVVGELYLKNSYFFPFKMTDGDTTDFISSIFRSFENMDVINDKIGIFVDITPIKEESIAFFIKSKWNFFKFKIRLKFQFFKYMFNYKVQKNWKAEGYKYYESKIENELFKTKIFIVVESSTKQIAINKLRSVASRFLIFKNYPLNQFDIKINTGVDQSKLKDYAYGEPMNMSSLEISNLICFPKNPQNETGLLKVTSKKLALPIGIPTFEYEKLKNGEIYPKNIPNNINIIGISDYRSINVPIGIFDEDRLRHIYVIGKTGVGKSKFLISNIINDIKQGRGLSIIDPHGDLIEEAISHIPANRAKDVIIFDPTDEKYPFCINPLDVSKDESKQILAKGFIDIFKKFFGSNWNPKLEHVLRMIFLALLDKPGATLFDIIRALTDKDFRYEMIETIEDDVVKNFWTNEFAGWSQQFNTEAIMPILNKVGQVLSIEVLKNIFSSKDNKLDFRKVMDEKKILLIKLPKGKLQEEIMGFLGAMFVTKIYQAAMSRQGLDKEKRIPFFLYVDEFQNFATDTFSEILSEARKYGLGLAIAHQFIKQIPENLTRAIFGNIGTLISFRISSEDSLYIKQHFEPYLDAYDLANLNQRCFYCKTMVKGQVKDPFSLKSLYIPDVKLEKDFLENLYALSRSKYSRSLLEAKKVMEVEQKDVLNKIENFAEPII